MKRWKREILEEAKEEAEPMVKKIEEAKVEAEPIVKNVEAKAEPEPVLSIASRKLFFQSVPIASLIAHLKK